MSEFQPTPAEQHMSDELHEVYTDVVPLVKETKDGWKTTEFWLTLAGVLALNVNAIPMPDKYQGFASAVILGLYAIARGIAKQGVPDVQEKPDVN